MEYMSATLICDKAIAGNAAKAVILYDQLETMLVANQLVGCLPTRTEGRAEWTVNSWRFDMLEQGLEGETALGETSDAGLMIVAIGDAHAVRFWPKEWLNRWAACRQAGGAALALVLVGAANQIEARSAVIVPLRRLAERSQLRLFIVDDKSATELRDVQLEWRYANCSPVFQQCPEPLQHQAEARPAVG